MSESDLVKAKAARMTYAELNAELARTLRGMAVAADEKQRARYGRRKTIFEQEIALRERCEKPNL